VTPGELGHAAEEKTETACRDEDPVVDLLSLNCYRLRHAAAVLYVKEERHIGAPPGDADHGRACPLAAQLLL
jgi:hypothetical protein